MLAKTLALGGLATLASAHIKMSNPVPFNKGTLDNSPLLGDGSNFPCKVRAGGSYDAQGASNVYSQGSTQQIALIGSAVHGGGSCQVSVTTDLQPTKNSVWKVIKSIEGGCPARGAVPGNLGGSANSPVPDKYDFTIPNELAAGNYTLAWSWFNRIGNREMYMNCAPLTVTGSGGSSGFMETLPDMFVAHIGKTSCRSNEGNDVKFPNPGKDVDRFGVSKNLVAPSGCGGDGGSQSGGSPSGGSPSGGSPSGGSPSGGSPSGGSPSAPTDQPGAASQPTYPASPSTVPDSPVNPSKPEKTGTGQNSPPGGVFATVTSGGAGGARQTDTSASETNLSDEAPASTSSPSFPAATKQPAPRPGNEQAPSGVHRAGTPCTSEGAWNCVAGTSFQRCASGRWSEVLDLAGGIACAPGQSDEFKLRAIQTKRALRRAFRLV